jgi:glycosyltransferase involved in cell wall biosynthesis
MSKTISCIIPTCDRKELLNITLHSVIKQTISPHEILIINNGNEIIDYKYLDIKNPEKFNIKIFNLPKYAGLAQALNFGSSISSSEYLAFLEDDDLWEENYIKKLLESLTDEYKVYVTRIDILKNGKIERYKNAKGKINLKNLFRFNPGINISNLCVNKKALFSISGFDPMINVGVDKCAAIDFLLNGYEIKVLDHIQEIGRFHEGVRLSNTNSNMLSSQISFYRKYRNNMNYIQKVKLLMSILYLKIFKNKKNNK